MEDIERARFAALFDTLSPKVYAYARRHVDAADAQDVVADTFLVAWRRFRDVPAEALPWLLVVARNTISNQRRSDRRRRGLQDSVETLDRLAGPASGADHDVVERMSLIEGLAQLSGVEREALLLVAWDGLNTRDAARVADCSHRAFEVRLSRARARLTRAAQDTNTTTTNTTTTTKGAVTA